VGGTFAPSLFLGGVLGAGFHNVASGVIETIAKTNPDLLTYSIVQGISGLPAFAMVGAASVLAALFRAPLTASLLLVSAFVFFLLFNFVLHIHND